MERISCRHVLGEIAFADAIIACQCQHLFNGILGDFPDARFDCAQVFGHEPALRQQPVFHMVRRIHLHEGADQVPVIVGRYSVDQFLARPVNQGGGSDGVGEQFIVAANL